MFESDHLLVHLVTICIGLIIAFGLGQIVELFQRRRRARKQQDAADQTQKPTGDSTPPTTPPTASL